MDFNFILKKEIIEIFINILINLMELMIGEKNVLLQKK